MIIQCRRLIAIGVLLAGASLARAEMRFAKPVADLGELRGGPIYRHRFEFENNSAETIEIVDIRLGCGCLQPVLDKRIFQAGEKGVLFMHVRTLGQSNGQRTWQARVQVRQGARDYEIALTIAATIRNEITIEPSILAMTVDTTLRQEVTIKDHRPTPAKVTAAQATTPAIRVTTVSQAGGVTKVILEVSRDTLTTDQQEAMLDIYIDDSHYHQLQVPITLRKASRPSVSATPANVEFRADSSGSKLVRLRGAGDRKVVVERVESGHPGMKCTWASGPGNDATLKITFDARTLPTAAPPVGVRVHLTAPSTTTLVIPVAIGKE